MFEFLATIQVLEPIINNYVMIEIQLYNSEMTNKLPFLHFFYHKAIQKEVGLSGDATDVVEKQKGKK